MNESTLSNKTKVDLRPFYWACLTHSFIILYGVLILILQFYNPFLN